MAAGAMTRITVREDAFLSGRERDRLLHALSVAAAKFRTDHDVVRTEANAAPEAQREGFHRLADEFGRYAEECEVLHLRIEASNNVVLHEWED